MNLYSAYFAMWLTTDIFGLGVPGEHHIIPQAIWNKKNKNPISFSKAAQNIFDSFTIFDPDHGNTKAHIAYSDAVRNMVEDYLQKTGIDPEEMTKKQAEDLMKKVQNSNNPQIKNFLDDIKVKQKTWFKCKFKLPFGKAFTGVAGALSIFPGILEDIENIKKSLDTGQTLEQVLAEKYKDSPTIITTFGVVENPWYGQEFF